MGARSRLGQEHFLHLLAASDLVLCNASGGKANDVLSKPACSTPETPRTGLLPSPAPLLFSYRPC